MSNDAKELPNKAVLRVQKRIVIDEFWDCGDPDHRHQSEDVAQRCIDKRLRKEAQLRKNDGKTAMELSFTRNLRAVRSILKGQSISEVAGLNNISPSRMSQILYKLCRNGIRFMPKDQLPYGDRSLEYFRNNADYYLQALDKLEADKFQQWDHQKEIAPTKKKGSL